MYFLFLWDVLKRAFSPTARVTDVLQILAASTLPAISKFVGIKLPATANNDVLAYIGLIAVSFIAIRLLWAPYSLWREQTGQITTLKLELTKPERLIMERLAKHRARARAKLAAKLEDLQTLSFANDEASKAYSLRQIPLQMVKVRQLRAEAGPSEAFDDGLGWFMVVIQEEAETLNDALPLDRRSHRLLTLLQRHLMGDLTAEGLARRLREDIAQETLP